MSACKGMNCGCTDGVSHSVECRAEYARVIDTSMRAGAREIVTVTTKKGEVILLDRDVFDQLPRGYFYVLGGYAWFRPSRTLRCKSFKVHRFALNAKNGDGQIIDHINGKKLDNRRENLRIVTKSLNALNKHAPYAGNATGHLGVRFDPRREARPYRAQITIDQKHRSLGSFATAEEAAAAYQKAKAEIFRARGGSEC